MNATAAKPTDPIVWISTADGARVAVKRKERAGGTPVVFLHGLAVNADLWDLPEIRGADFHYRSLASMLYAAGYDIWLVNLRGHGAPRMHSTPAPDQTDWCVDHFILYDLPAVVGAVIEQTGHPPFIIGASMGAMTLAGYLQGAHWAAESGEGRIIADVETAQARQQQLLGCVLVELPAVLRWPDSLYDDEGRLDWRALVRDWWRRDGDVNYPFEIVARSGWLQALLQSVGEVPVHWVKGNGNVEPWYRRLPGPLARGVERLERGTVQAMLRFAGTFTGATHHRAEVMLHGRRYVLDHMKAGVLKQLAKCVRKRAFVSELGSPDHVYSDHYDLVDVALLVVHGRRDRIANAGLTRTLFFDCVRSADKKFVLDDDIAHGEIEAAPIACERLYPRVVAWLNARNSTAEARRLGTVGTTERLSVTSAGPFA